MTFCLLRPYRWYQVSGPILVLNGEGEKSSGPVNNVVFLEETAPSYAPEVFRHLLACFHAFLLY